MLLLAAAAASRAERLPIRVYTVGDGLAGDTVRTFLEDSRGYLWIGTSSGLSRFGGQLFRTYDTRDGLPGPRIESLAETPDGAVWVATAEGIARLLPGAAALPGRPRFEPVPLPGPGPPLISGLFAERGGRVWVGSRDRWLVFEPPAPGDTKLAPPHPAGLPRRFQDAGALEQGPGGEVWIGGYGILRWNGTKETASFTLGPGRTPENLVADLLFDGERRLWLVTGRGEVLVTWPGFDRAESAPPLRARARYPSFPGELPAQPGEVILYDPRHGLPDDSGLSLAAGRDGVWIASHAGAAWIGARTMRRIGPAHGLPEPLVMSLFEDRDGTVWFGTESRGLARLRRSGLVIFEPADGLDDDRVSGMFEDADGTLLVHTRSRHLARLDGGRFVSVTPRRLFAGVPSGWGWNQYILRDRRGRVWYPTAAGLFRYAVGRRIDDLRDAAPERRITTAEGLPGGDVFRLYEDRQGDIWASLIAEPPLVRFVGGERLEVIRELRGAATGGAPTAFAEDRAGGLWMGFYLGGLARRDEAGWRFFGLDQGLPPGFVSDLLLDRRGRLWLTTWAGGVARIEDPTAARLTVRRYRVEDGLASDSARCIAEGEDGAMYVGNARGLDRLDVETGNVRSYTVDDGMPNNFTWNCLAARDGKLWFGTLHGLVQLDPRAEAPRKAPALKIAAVRIAGAALPVPELGTAEISGLVLEPAQNGLEIELEAVGLDQDARQLVQYRLDGDASWTEPAAARTLSFPRLAPGSYEVEMRSVSRDGQTSAPARMSFRLLPPLYSRPWVKAGAAALLGLLGWGALRLRVGRLLAVERARTRIASDLHDDVGSGLSRIGMLGEIARRRLRESPDETLSVLDQLGRETAELAENAAEIIWSVDPHQDDFESVVVRLRRFAADLCEARGIELHFSSPPGAAQVELRPEVRRAVYLVLKEAIHNAAKYSRARTVEVRIGLRDGVIVAEVRDDGRGVDAERIAEAERDGHRGLPGMRRRAQSVGGRIDVESSPGAGTRIALSVPLRRGRRPSHGDAKRPPLGGDTNPLS